jgi:hypothetical protein
MPCGGGTPRPKPNQIVQIAVKRTAAKKLIDHHCDKCPYVGPHEQHVCKPHNRIAWQETRQATCNRCPYNTDGVCVLYQLHHPDRDCVIDVGVTLPYAACPAGLWPRVEWTCSACGTLTQDESGVTKCDSCDAKPLRRVSMPYLAKFAAEQPWTPSRPRLVVTLASEALEITRAAMEAYATRCNADFRILDDAAKGYTQANKFRLANLANQYNRVLVIDPEIWITPNAPDVFSFPDGAAYYRNDASVVLFDGPQSSIWTAPRLPIIDRKQAVWLQLQANIEAQSVHAGIFDRRWNWRWQAKEEASQAYFVNLVDCPTSWRQNVARS